MGGAQRQLVAAVACGLLAACTSGKSGSPTASGPPIGSTFTSTPSTTPSTLSSPGSTASGSAAWDWTTYHGDPQRTGFSASMPQATGRLSAKNIPLDSHVYAAPIVVNGQVIVATEGNAVYSFTRDGAKNWSINLGSPTPRSSLPCGNIDPLGITGTPIYDAATKLVFVVASIGSRVRHELVAIDPDTGAPKWRRSVDLPGTDAQAMQQRGGLTILAGRVWVPFGGLAGDCGAYKGRLVGVPTGNGEPVAYTVPTTREAGIWTPPGPSVLAGHLLVSVGNGQSVGGSYDFSDSVLELDGPKLVDFFSPTTWASDNAADLDLGSQGPAVVQEKWIFIAGKSGMAYVLRAGRLGGIGGEVSQAKLCKSFGGTAVVGSTVFVPCADGVRAVQIDNAGHLKTLWRAASSTQGSPVVGGGRVYALDRAARMLRALDATSGRVREQVTVGAVSRFATPAISGSRLFVGTLSGLAIVEAAR